VVAVICCISNEEQFNEFCAPSLLETSSALKKAGLDPLEIITIKNGESIFKGYNQGIRQAKSKIKVFIHQDVDLLNSSWVFKLLNAFASNPSYGLLGLTGTQKFQNKGFWWASGQQYVVGELFSGLEKVNWVFRPLTKLAPVECIDGFFMATNREVMFDETLEGFHLYDMDYCRTIARAGYKIGVIPHKAWHIGAIRKQDTQKYFDAYNRKWNLI
jgi:GT2 family glycosyltransferase